MCINIEKESSLCHKVSSILWKPRRIDGQ